ncbi:hypothetical protein IE53DRAFT_96392 [Violaceomyces palustris]|uniref:Uncharacterized protein n=1 Tax=Violaceomyces palustris TaxID=1673888 RepID=A0ACD0P7B0_9BASI|nr:hypothetical protein IE53DRAFT_96392 [Violaceomyces palustris]
MQSFCDVPRSGQGQLPSNFWKNPHYKKTSSWVQITGCINPNAGGRLDPNDGGGQYDSSGGDGGLGNPRGSKCTGYNHYVELVEPDVGRACIRCCQNYNDCRLDRDTSGCPAVIPGDYSC